MYGFLLLTILEAKELLRFAAALPLLTITRDQLRIMQETGRDVNICRCQARLSSTHAACPPAKPAYRDILRRLSRFIMIIRVLC